MAKYRNHLSPLVATFKALGDESRLRTFNVLRDGELCVCQIVELLGLAPSTVSKHMSILKQAGLVASRKEGRWIYYRLADFSDGVPDMKVVDQLGLILDQDEQGNRDQRQIKKILKCNPEDLCKKQCQK